MKNTFGVTLGYIISIASDTMFMVCVQHGCGLFAILGRKLQRIGRREKPKKFKNFTNLLKKNDEDFENLVLCIRIHDHAIAYADLIENTYSGPLFFIMGLNILLITLTGFQVIGRTTATYEKIRFAGACIISIVHLYIYSSMSQNLMDHSVSVHSNILNGSWYVLPLNIQKNLYLMLMRCNVPCRLTAGKVSIMCIESFAEVLKTSFSYLMVLRSE